MADSMAGQEKYKMSKKARKYSKKIIACQKGTETSLKGLTGQIGNNLSIQIMAYKSLSKRENYESILI